MTPTPNLQLSEILQTLVDEGSLSEGSAAYLAAQKAVREGTESLSEAELEMLRRCAEPLLASGRESSSPPRPPG